jgi:multiple sugar transport system substrate-binding protein
MVNPNFLLKDKNGTPVGVSPLGSIFILFVNKDLVKQAGLDPDTEIKTWVDYKKISDQITANGNGKIFGGGIPSHPHAGGALRASPFIRQLGADFGDGSKVTINTPEMIKALTFIREMNRDIPKGLGNNPDEGPLYNSFTKG